MRNTDNLKRKKFIKNEYSKYWLRARKNKYGVMPYDKALCNLMMKEFQKRSKILEVGIGTGFPFAIFMLNKGFDVYGIDISPMLIKECRTKYPEIKARVGDAENIPFSSKYFDGLYCYHSTWYFTNIGKVFNEMIRVTKDNGKIIFDIQNFSNSQIKNKYFHKLKMRKKRSVRIVNYIKNFFFLLAKKPVNWNLIIYETPTDPTLVINSFSKHKLTILAPNPYPSSNLIKLDLNDLTMLKNFPRIVFLIQKCQF